MNTIAIIDYGMGNLHSVAKALELVGDNAKIIITNQARDIKMASRVLFPGVGAIRDCIDGLEQLALHDAIKTAVAEKPVLAVCVGMQAIMDFSEENEGTHCLGLLPGKVRLFPAGMQAPDNGSRLKIPHMGWNQVHQAMDHVLWKGIAQNSRFYFVHSYYVSAADDSVVAGSTQYGIGFSAALAKENLFAVQFHPEKSQHAGLMLLKNFVNWSLG